MKCLICGKEFEGLGNNPSPFKREVCCNECNDNYILHGKECIWNDNLVLTMRLVLSGTVDNIILVLTPYGDIIAIKVENDEEVSLEGFQNLVDGYVEVYPMKHEHLLFLVDEEGLIKQKKFNDLAFELFGIDVVGNLVLCPKKHFK